VEEVCIVYGDEILRPGPGMRKPQRERLEASMDIERRNFVKVFDKAVLQVKDRASAHSKDPNLPNKQWMTSHEFNIPKLKWKNAAGFPVFYK
jgi:hypothetical protein